MIVALSACGIDIDIYIYFYFAYFNSIKAPASDLFAPGNFLSLG